MWCSPPELRACSSIPVSRGATGRKPARAFASRPSSLIGKDQFPAGPAAGTAQCTRGGGRGANRTAGAGGPRRKAATFCLTLSLPADGIRNPRLDRLDCQTLGRPARGAGRGGRGPGILGRRRPRRARGPLLGLPAPRAPRDQPARDGRPEHLADGVVRHPLRPDSPAARALGRLRHGPARARRDRQGHLRPDRGRGLLARGDRRGAPRGRGGGPRPAARLPGRGHQRHPPAGPPLRHRPLPRLAPPHPQRRARARGGAALAQAGRAPSARRVHGPGARGVDGRALGLCAQRLRRAARRAEEPPGPRDPAADGRPLRVDSLLVDPARRAPPLRGRRGPALRRQHPLVRVSVHGHGAPARGRDGDPVAADRPRGPPAREGLGGVLFPGRRRRATLPSRPRPSPPLFARAPAPPGETSGSPSWCRRRRRGSGPRCARTCAARRARTAGAGD